MGMKTIRMIFSDESGEKITVLGKGDPLQTTEQIVDLVKPKVRKYIRGNEQSSEIELEDIELLQDTEIDQTDSDLISFQVNHKTDERFCGRNYGYRYERKDHPKAEGPAGPTKLG